MPHTRCLSAGIALYPIIKLVAGPENCCFPQDRIAIITRPIFIKAKKTCANSYLGAIQCAEEGIIYNAAFSTAEKSRKRFFVSLRRYWLTVPEKVVKRFLRPWPWKK